MEQGWGDLRTVRERVSGLGWVREEFQSQEAGRTIVDKEGETSGWEVGPRETSRVKQRPRAGGSQVRTRAGGLLPRDGHTHLDPEGTAGLVHQHDVLGLEISVDDGEFLEPGQGPEYLQGDRADVAGGEGREVVLLLEFEKVLLQQLEDQVELEGVVEELEEADDVGLLGVQAPHAAQQLQLVLDDPVAVGVVLQDLDGHHLARASPPALGHLPEGALAQHLDDVIAVSLRLDGGHGAPASGRRPAATPVPQALPPRPPAPTLALRPPQWGKEDRTRALPCKVRPHLPGNPQTPGPHGESARGRTPPPKPSRLGTRGPRPSRMGSSVAERLRFCCWRPEPLAGMGGGVAGRPPPPPRGGTLERLER